LSPIWAKYFLPAQVSQVKRHQDRQSRLTEVKAN